jgi:hypothetical protein
MFRLYKVGSLEEMVLFLNGGVAGSMKMQGFMDGFVGNDLTFARPSFTLTFSDTHGNGLLSPADIKSQIETASSGNLTVQLLPDGRIAFVETVISMGVALDSTSEVVKTKLGLSVDAENTPKEPVGSSSAPRVENIYEVTGTYAVLTWEV